MKHIVRYNKDNEPQGVHIPGATKSQTIPWPQCTNRHQDWTNHKTEKHARCQSYSNMSYKSAQWQYSNTHMSNNQHCKCMYHRDKVVCHLDPMIRPQDLRQYIAWNLDKRLISGKQTPLAICCRKPSPNVNCLHNAP